MRYFLTLIALVPLPLSAATIDLVLYPAPESGSIVSMRMDTEGETINAVEGILHIPEGLTVREIIDGDSFVHFWIERPKIADGMIRFSGITPGGYVGRERELFSIALEAAPGEYPFELKEARALLNDGEATAVPLQLGTTRTADSMYDLTDTIPPEPFTVARGSDPDLFEGRPFVVFASSDKHSGIKTYEVAYSWIPLGSFVSFLPWRETESPHPLLSDSYLYVRATDAAGNSRIATLSPENGVPLTMRVIGFGILLAFGLCVLYYAFTRLRR